MALADARVPYFEFYSLLPALCKLFPIVVPICVGIRFGKTSLIAVKLLSSQGFAYGSRILRFSPPNGMHLANVGNDLNQNPKIYDG